MVRLAKEDPRIYAITAAMKSGTGLSAFAAAYPERFSDVGIAEEHAVTFASGLATKGMLPVFAVYSTFLQRCYDQLLNDTAIMNNHVVLAVDRAGIVPDDGTTHQGVFDTAFLNTLPNTSVYAPATFEELRLCLRKAVYHTEGIAVVRYPKGGEPPLEDYVADMQPYRLWEKSGAETLLVTYGRLFGEVEKAARELSAKGIPVAVLKLTQIKPIEFACAEIAKRYARIVFIEEGSKKGGIAESFGNLLLQENITSRYEIYAVDGFIPTCKVEQGLRLTGLDAESIVSVVMGKTVKTEMRNDYA